MTARYAAASLQPLIAGACYDRAFALVVCFINSALRATTPGWEGVEDGFAMKALTGGMTNAVFRCSKPGGENSTVLLRSYGQGTEVITEASGLAG